MSVGTRSACSPSKENTGRYNDNRIEKPTQGNLIRFSRVSSFLNRSNPAIIVANRCGVGCHERVRRQALAIEDEWRAYLFSEGGEG